MCLRGSVVGGAFYTEGHEMLYFTGFSGVDM